jgi:cytochrome c biogenesis protein CcmG/thiol:disulfide interchange protein DsbE
MRRFVLPAAVFFILLGFLAVGLRLKPQELPSALIGRPAPAFELPQVTHASHPFRSQDMQGKVWVLNVWASWCGPCRAEHPLLLELSRQHLAPIVGLNYTDQMADSQRWLSEFGDPYVNTAFDANGRVGMDFGVYGVPETYLIDKQGKIRFKHVGPVTPDVIRDKLTPMIAELNRA